MASMQQLSISTPRRACWIDVTAEVEAHVAPGAKAVLVSSPHTTAGVTINENADPDVQSDFFAKLTRLVPQVEAFYRHGEGNSDAHILTSLVGTSVLVPVENGKLVLGTWQAIYLCEFDGPRRRTLHVQSI
jgi:secondary thiamine-phosphate synthase enzyme